MAHFINSQGLSIHFRQDGENNRENGTILFFDGFCSPMNLFPNPFVDVLKEYYHCVSFDYRGYGESSPSAYNSMAWCAFDAKELLEHLELRRVTLYGHSMGVSVILAYFKEFGDLYIDKIIICDQPACVTSRDDWPYGRIRGRQDLNALLEATTAMFHDYKEYQKQDMPWTFPAAYPELGFPPEMMLSLEDMMGGSDDGEGGIDLSDEAVRNVDPMARMATWLDSCYQDYRPVVPTVQVPALVLAPNPGTLYMFEASEYYRDHLGGPVEFVELKPGSHFAPYEHFDTTLHAITEFMKS